MYNYDNFDEHQKPIIIGERGDYDITFVNGKNCNVNDIKVYTDYLAVQGKKSRNWKLVDAYGNFSEAFSEILGYKNGFFAVRGLDNTIKYRDLIGRTSDSITRSGSALNDFKNGKCDISDLEVYWFEDIRFLLAVVHIEEKRIATANPSKYNTAIKRYILRQDITRQLQEAINNYFSTGLVNVEI